MQPDSAVKLCELLVDDDSHLTVTAMCEQVGISRHCYYDWLSDEDFLKLLQKYRDKTDKDNAPRTDKALHKAIASGDVAAMRLYYEKRGDLKNKSGNSNEVSVKLEFPPLDKPVEGNEPKL